ncbi:MAG: diacylglycerol kinase [Zoogloea sp.]|nr:diacylglycerol kinase [Zoogloea sp.]
MNPRKNSPLWQRTGFALAGVRCAFASEVSLRTHFLATIFAQLSLWYLEATPLWVAIVSMMCGVMMAAELLNTALEKALDGLHPERAEFVRQAKDCAAGAVLILSFAALVVYGAMLWDLLGR